MSNWDASDEDDGRNNNERPGGQSSFCVQSEKEASDAQDVCDALRIPMHRASFAAEYWTGVFEPFVESIESGRMPNPDGELLVSYHTYWGQQVLWSGLCFHRNNRIAHILTDLTSTFDRQLDATALSNSVP